MTCSRFSVLAILIVLVAPAYAEQCASSFATHGDPLFGAIGPGIGGQATVVNAAQDAQACVESAACVEELFPIADSHGLADGCPFDYGAEAGDAQRLDEFGKRAATFDGSCFLRFALTAASQQRHEFVPVLKARLHDGDARSAMAAALALRDLSDADVATWQGAAQHWYPPVRELAHAAMYGTDSALLDAQERSFWTRVEHLDDAFAQRWCEAQTVSWRDSRPQGAPLRDADDDASEPLAAMSLSHEQGWAVCGPAKKPLSFAGGTLIGTNMGEWGGSAYFFRAPELPRPLLSDNVRGARASGDRVQLYASLAHMSLSQSRMYRIALDAQRVPQVVAEIEFPEAAWRERWRNDTITVIGFSGIVYELGPEETHPRVLGCVRNVSHFFADPPLAQPDEPFAD